MILKFSLIGMALGYLPNASEMSGARHSRANPVFRVDVKTGLIVATNASATSTWAVHVVPPAACVWIP